MPVVVPMGVVVRVPVGVTVVVMVVFQHPGAHQVHGQAQHGGGDGLVIADGQWIDHALHRFHQHGDGHAHQQQCAGVAPQNLHFPGAEGKAAVPGIAGGHAEAKTVSPRAKACELMCQPSAISAMELKIQPPAISSTITTSVSHITQRVRRSATGLPWVKEWMTSQLAGAGEGVSVGFMQPPLEALYTILQYI